MTAPTSNADVSDSPEAEADATATNQTTAHESSANNDTEFFTVPLADGGDDACWCGHGVALLRELHDVDGASRECGVEAQVG